MQSFAGGADSFQALFRFFIFWPQDGPHFPLHYHTFSYPPLVQKWMANLPSPLNYSCFSRFPFSNPQLLSMQKLKLQSLAEIPRYANSRVSMNKSRSTVATRISSCRAACWLPPAHRRKHSNYTPCLFSVS